MNQRKRASASILRGNPVGIEWGLGGEKVCQALKFGAKSCQGSEITILRFLKVFNGKVRELYEMHNIIC
jgi:hypothetical protein